MLLAHGPRSRAAVKAVEHRHLTFEPDAGAGQGRKTGQRVWLPDRPRKRAGRTRARAEGRSAPGCRSSKSRGPRGAGAPVGDRSGRAAGQGQERLRAAGRARARGRDPRAPGVRIERGGGLAERTQRRAQAGCARAAGGVRRLRERDLADRARRPADAAVGGRSRDHDQPGRPRDLAAAGPGRRAWSEERHGDHLRAGRAPRPRRAVSRYSDPEEVFERRAGHGRGARRPAPASTTRRSAARRVCSGPARRRSPGAPRLFAEQFAFADGRARFPRRAPPAGRRAARRLLPALLRPAATKSTTARAPNARCSRWWTPNRHRACRSTRAQRPAGVVAGGIARWRPPGEASGCRSRSSADLRTDAVQRPFTGAARPRPTG